MLDGGLFVSALVWWATRGNKLPNLGVFVCRRDFLFFFFGCSTHSPTAGQVDIQTVAQFI
jgi:hypothetical protein